MYSRSLTYSVLQAIAVTVSLATILWSLGVPSLRFAEAANVTSFSNTLTDSSHSIEFVTPSGLTAGDLITLTFPAGFGNIGNLDFNDLDLAVNGTDQTLAGSASGATWGVNAAGQVIDITSGTATIGANATVTIEIGLNATSGATGDTEITNPGTATSYEIDLEFGTANDSGTTIVAIVDTVTVRAAVDTSFTFAVAGVNAGESVNNIGTDDTSATTTATEVPFGNFNGAEARTAAQNLTVSTNAASGFVVTVQTDQQLTAESGAVIDGFANGSFTASPTGWIQPSETIGQLNTYGHWGLSSNDTTLTDGLTDLYSGGDNYVSASTTPVEVFRNDGPSAGSDDGIGTATVIYKLETTDLQEAGEYTATLTYVATPVF